MLQKQYYTYKLSKTQIDHILANYNIKYTTMKTDIESKLANMIQVFLKDIFAFLENIEEIASEKDKLKEFDRMKKELKSASQKLLEKTKNEIKLQSTISSLSKEVASLKEKLNRNSRNTSTIQSPKSECFNQPTFTERMSYTAMYKTPKKASITIRKRNDNRSNVAFSYKEPLSSNSMKDVNKFINSRNEERYSLNNNNISNRIRLSKFINEVGTISKREDTESSREEKDSAIKTFLKEYDDVIKDEIIALEKEEENLKEVAKLVEEDDNK